MAEEPTPQSPTEGREQAAPKDMQHEPHEQARPRVLWGIAAVLIIVVGIIVWSTWGEEIKEACFGDGEVCEVEIEGLPKGGATFEQPEGFEAVDTTGVNDIDNM